MFRAVASDQGDRALIGAGVAGNLIVSISPTYWPDAHPSTRMATFGIIESRPVVFDNGSVPGLAAQCRERWLCWEAAANASLQGKFPDSRENTGNFG
jgi:hypothetical protein